MVMEYKNEIRNSLYEVSKDKKAWEISDNDLIFYQLHIDSIGFMQFILELEDRTEVVIEPELLDVENFNTINRVNELILNLLSPNSQI